jgi:hypothetical protein
MLVYHWSSSPFDPGCVSLSRESTLEEVQSWPVADQLDLIFQLWGQIVDNGWTPPA